MQSIGYLSLAFILANLPSIRTDSFDCKSPNFEFHDVVGILCIDYTSAPAKFSSKKNKEMCEEQGFQTLMPKTEEREDAFVRWLKNCCTRGCTGFIGLYKKYWDDGEPYDRYPSISDGFPGESVYFRYNRAKDLKYKRIGRETMINVTHVFCQSKDTATPHTCKSSSTTTTSRSTTPSSTTTRSSSTTSSSTTASSSAESSSDSTVSSSKATTHPSISSTPSRFSNIGSTPWISTPTEAFATLKNTTEETDESLPALVWVSFALIIESVIQLICVFGWLWWDIRRERKIRRTMELRAAEGQKKISG